MIKPSYLLDTNIVSDLVRNPQGADNPPGCITWQGLFILHVIALPAKPIGHRGDWPGSRG